MGEATSCSTAGCELAALPAVEPPCSTAGSVIAALLLAAAVKWAYAGGKGSADDAACACEEGATAGWESGDCAEQAARSIVTLFGCPTICLDMEIADSARLLSALLESGSRTESLCSAAVPAV